MKKYLFTTILAGALTLAAGSALGQSFSDIQGKWTLQKKTDRFGDATQTVEFKDNAFTYKVTSKEGDTLLYAKGKAKVEKLGPFNVVKLTDIEGGNSESNLQSVDDDRTIIYSTGWNTLTVAVNFDRSRDGEDTTADTYNKAK
jgi:hypothetical protein